MTLTVQYSPSVHDGDAIEVTFAYGFLIEAADELTVTVDGVVVSNYSVAGVGNDAGGTITFDAAPASGTNNILIERNVDQEQTTNFGAYLKFPAEVMETALDYLTRLVQDARERVDRALRRPANSTHWDAQDLKIENLQVPTVGTDAATLQTVIDLVASAGGGGGGGGISSYIGSIDPGHPPAVVGDIWFDTSAGRIRARRSNGLTWDAAFDPLVDTNAADIAALQALNTVTAFRQASAPTANAVGDIWLDSDDSDAVYHWNGSSWLPVQDARVTASEATWDQAAVDAAQALLDAAAAQLAADGKITVYYQTAAPGSAEDGDLWLRDTDNRLHVWDSGGWVESMDQSLAQALVDITGLEDGKAVVYYQPSEPAHGSSNDGDIWIDSDTDNNLVYVFDSGIPDYIPAGESVTTYRQDNQPSTSTSGHGDIWIDTDDGNHPYVFDSGTSTWISVRDSNFLDDITGSVSTDNIVGNGVTQVTFIEDLGSQSAPFNTSDGVQTALLNSITPQESNVPILVEAHVYIVGQNNVGDLHRFNAKLQVRVNSGSWSTILVTRTTFISASEDGLKSFTYTHDVGASGGDLHEFRLRVESLDTVADGNIVWADPQIKLTELKR